MSFGRGGMQVFGGSNREEASGLAASQTSIYLTGRIDSDDAGIDSRGYIKNGGFQGYLLALDLNSGQPTSPLITSPLLVSTAQNVPFLYRITASPGPATVDATNLPGTISLDGDTLTGVFEESGAFEIFLFASTPAGNVLARLNITVEPDMLAPPPIVQGDIAGLAVDAAGNQYVVGATYGTKDCNPQVGADYKFLGSGSVVTRYNADGTYAWTQLVAGADALGVQISGSTLYVTGSFQYRITIPGGYSVLPSGGKDAFVLALNKDTGLAVTTFGTQGLVRFGGSSGDDVARALVISGSTLYLGGTFASTNANLDGAGTFASSGREDGFVLTMNAQTGALINTFGSGGLQKFGGTDTDGMNSFLISGSTLYAAGHFISDNFGIGGVGTIADTSSDGYIVALNATTGAAIAGFGTGGILKIGGSGSEYLYSIAAAGSTLYVAGTLTGNPYTGQVYAFNASNGAAVAGFGTNGLATYPGLYSARALLISGSTLFIGGDGTDAIVMAANLSNGQLIPSFGVNGKQTIGGTQGEVGNALALSGTTLYFAGRTTSDTIGIGGPGTLTAKYFGGFLLPLNAGSGQYNTPPVATVSLNSTSPATNELLTATAVASDANADPVTLTYVWKVNGVTRKTTAAASALSDTFDLGLAGNGAKGDSILVVVTPHDGKIAGSGSFAVATIANSSPAATVQLNKSSPKTNEILTATATSDDADTDNVTLTYVWKVNGAERKTTTTAALSDTFDLSAQGNGGAGDTVTVEVTPFDGFEYGTAASATATVANTPPTVTANFDSQSPRTGELLTVSVTPADDDAQPLLITYVWKVNGVVKQTTASTSALSDTLDLSILGNGDKSDTVSVEVIPYDGIVTGNSAIVSATVVNSPPVATVVFENNTPGTSDVLVATATFNDADGDTVVLKFVWKVNEQVRRERTTFDGNDSFDLATDGNGQKGDVVTVEVTPNDGVADGDIASASVTIVNSSPTYVSAVSATPTDAYTRESISFSASVIDADGDPVVVTWDFADGTSATGAVVSHAYANAGTFVVIAAVSDGTATKTSQVTVSVSAPANMPFAKGSLKLTFTAANKDSLSLAGSTPISNGTRLNGVPVEFQIGALTVNGLSFDSKLTAGDGKLISLKLKAKMEKGSGGIIAPPDAKYTLTLKNQSLLAPLAEFGFFDENASKKKLPIMFRIKVGATTYEATATAEYTAKQGKSGSAKLSAAQ